MLRVKDVIDTAKKLAPEGYAYDWDNVGLQIGTKDKKIRNLLLTLDVNKAIINEAVKKDCGLIISHHPFIFKPINSINADTYKGRIIYQLVKKDINVFVMHTNLDMVQKGLNDYLCQLLNINNCKIIQPEGSERLFKLVVFIPEDYFEKVKMEILDNGAGYIGNYSHTSFAMSGKGTFEPLNNSKPFIGDKGKVNEVDEVRMETIVKEDHLKHVIKSLLTVHPYEEVAYDIYPLKNNQEKYGLGRIGELEHEVQLKDLIKKIKNKLGIPQIRFVGDLSRRIYRVAVCNGSGAELISKAAMNGADLFISGDLKYHDGQLAAELGLAVIDAGHYYTESIVRELLYNYFKDELKGINIYKSVINTNPWNNK